MKGPFSAALLAAAALFVAGCSGRFESFQFQTAEGARIEMRQSPRRSRADETRFQPAPGRLATPTYRLASPLAVPSGGQAFALSYSNSLPDCRLTILSDKGAALKTAALPPSSGTRLRYLVPLKKGDRIWGFQLTTPSAGAAGSLELSGAGTAPFVHGFAIEQDGLAVDGSVAVLSASHGAVDARIPAATRQEMAQGIWAIEIGTQPAAGGGAVTFISEEGKSVVFDVSPSHAPNLLTFARGSISFLPVEVKVAGAVTHLEISQLSTEAPLPADPGSILTWDVASWRHPDFELFSWDRFPHVLIFDTARYDVQDALFNRLAFFVEKAGHAGKIEPPSALAGIHGYNAHDYRAEDLARFFTAAGTQGVALSAAEEKLAALLVENGVIQKTASGYSPGEGGVISISRGSSPILRDLLLTHECFHGAFFSLPAFREATEKEWASLSPVEQQVWKDFLASRSYNVEDHYLLVNEFQSYLLQQERLYVTGFQSLTLGRMRAASPAGAALVKRFLAAHPSSFLGSFDVLDGALQSAGGPPGGDAAAIRLAR
ncbi:MAG: hypothetical protein ABSG63_14875 [Spirochaetia bacterium]